MLTSASVPLQPRDPGRGLSFSLGVCSGGAGEEETAYLEVEAVERWAELLPAGQTVPLAAAGHAGEEAEQQEVAEQGFHGAGAGGKTLKHRGGCATVRTASGGDPHPGDTGHTLFRRDSAG